MAENESYLRFFSYLCFSSFFDRETHRLVIPTKKMADAVIEAGYSSKFIGEEFLEGFRDSVLPDLVWTEYVEPGSDDLWKGKAREVLQLGFDQEMQARLRDEMSSTSEDLVDLVSGKDYVREDRYRERKRTDDLHTEVLARHHLNSTQTKMLEYLRSISGPHLLLRKLDENQSAITAAINALPPHVQEMRYRILRHVRHDPQVRYVPSSRGHTCRLSAAGDSILGLKKEVRKAATKGWWECDLRSSQFAILAARLEAPLAQEFIASGESIWSEFNRFLFNASEEPTPAVKRAMKEAIYSLCFGKGVRALKAFLAGHGMSRLLRHPILRELLALRKRWFDEIVRAGGAHDVWRQWHVLTNERWAGAIAGTVIQSIEMEIIAPIFDVANVAGESDQFKIVLFQHDGATISFNSTERLGRAQRKLKKAVEERAQELGVRTVLEFARL